MRVTRLKPCPFRASTSCGAGQEFLRLFAVIGEDSVFGVVVGVEHGDHQLLHVSGVEACKIVASTKVKVMVLPSGELLACIRG